MKSTTKLRRLLGGGAIVAAGALALAACGSSTAAPKVHPTTSTAVSGKPIKGGVVTWAEAPDDTPNYIFPFQDLSYFSVSNDEQFEYLMYRPLYWFGTGDEPTLNPSLSLASTPTFSHDGRVAVINLKHYAWSDGETVDAQDVLFWMNMLKTEKLNWAAYVPGDFPDNVTNVVATGKYQVTFDLNGSYNPTWFTYNELSQITPMPVAWDVTSLGAKAGSGGCSTASYASITTTAKGAPVSASAKACNAVYDFLSLQSGYNPTNPSANDASALTTWATSPIWSVVDGPWHLVSFSASGKAVFDPNPDYSGPSKPIIAQFVELPYTSGTAELDALAASTPGNVTLDYGYITTTSLTASAPAPGEAGPNNPSVASLYRLIVGYPWSINYFVVNFTSNQDNGAAGAIFSQLYFRQAFQSLVDQPAYIEKIDKNYGEPTYGPVPVEPPTWASSTERSNPYPYSVAKATSLLKSHGWKVVPSGTSTCTKPGTASNECGAGIAKGAQLDFNLVYASGNSQLTELMDDEQSSWAQAGIKINLSEQDFNSVVALASPTSKSWEMANWGAGWIFAPDYYPTGGEIFATGAGSNSGDYNNTNNNTLIAETHTSSSSAPFDAYQNYLAKQLPVVWQPNPLTIVEVVKNLHVPAIDPLEGITPETWYFTSAKA
jgi:peptide/nickel transport system substrate-binding protein